MYDAGVPILAGTDANSSPICPIPHGDSLHHELEPLVEASLSTIDALQADPPDQVFDLPDRGVISQGLHADLILLSANPLEDIRGTREMECVWIGGVEVESVKSHWARLCAHIPPCAFIAVFQRHSRPHFMPLRADAVIRHSGIVEVVMR